MNAELIFRTEDCPIEVLSLTRTEDQLQERFVRNALLPLRKSRVSFINGKYSYEPSEKYQKIYWLNRKK